MSVVIKSTTGLYRPWWTVYVDRSRHLMFGGSERDIANMKRKYTAQRGHGGVK